MRGHATHGMQPDRNEVKLQQSSSQPILVGYCPRVRGLTITSGSQGSKSRWRRVRSRE